MSGAGAHVSADRRAVATPTRLGPVGRFVMLAIVGLLALIAAGAALRLPWPAIVVSSAALTTAVAVFALLLRRDHPHRRLGAANVVTLVRLVVVALLLGILLGGAGDAVVVIAVSVVSLSLDGVDGHLARRQKLESGFGATFDMEVDSAFALVLSALAALGPAGPAALLLGLPRYIFGLASLAAPWLNAPLAPRTSRKVVCVVQLIALIALQIPWIGTWLALTLVGGTLALLVWSFSVDIIAQRRALHRSRR